MIEKLGGRKFVLTLICVAVGTAVELYTARGITAQFAGLLAALVAAFGAANAYNTKQYLEAEPTPEATVISAPDVTPQIEELKEQVAEATATANAAGQAVSSIADQVVQLRKLAAAALKIGG